MEPVDPFQVYIGNTNNGSGNGTYLLFWPPPQDRPPSSGVREPRRPLPMAPAGVMAVDIHA